MIKGLLCAKDNVPAFVSDKRREKEMKNRYLNIVDLLLLSQVLY